MTTTNLDPFTEADLIEAIESVQADSRIILVDHAHNGDLCEWICRKFDFDLLISNQPIIDEERKSISTAPRDNQFFDRARRLNPRKVRPMSLDTETVLKRFGNRRFDLAFCFRPDMSVNLAQWGHLVGSRTTGGMICYQGGLHFWDGRMAIPKRDYRPIMPDDKVDLKGVDRDPNDLRNYKAKA